MTSVLQSPVAEALEMNPPNTRIVTDTTYAPLVINYRAPNDTAVNRFALVNVSANGDIQFFRGSSATNYTLSTLISLGATGKVDVSAAAYNTFGEVNDAINAGTSTHGFSCLVRDALRSDSSNNTLALSTQTLAGVQSDGIALLGDDAVSLQIACQIAKRRHFGNPSNTGWTPIVRRVRSLVDFATGAAQVRLYQRKGTTENEIARWAGGADDTELDKDIAGGTFGGGIWGDPDSELIVVSRAVSTFGAHSDAYLNVEYEVINNKR